MTNVLISFLFSVAQPVITLSTVGISIGLDKSDAKLEAKCSMSQLTNHAEHGEYWYEASWFIDDSLVWVSETVLYDDLQATSFFLDDSPVFRMGTNVRFIIL